MSANKPDHPKPSAKRQAPPPSDAAADPKKIKQVNQMQRDLREQLEAKNEELANPNSQAVEAILGQVNTVFKEASTVKHLVVDSELMLDISQAVQAQVAKIGKAHAPITVVSFKNQLRALFGENHINWVKLGRELRVYGSSIPAYDVMLGPVEVVPPPKKEKVAAPKAVKEKFELEKPLDMASAAAKAANENKAADGFEVLKLVEREIRHEIESQTAAAGGGGSRTPIDAFELLVNPESFAQTVENIFAFSFLVKDGMASLKLGEDGTPQTQSMDRPKPKDRVSETQAILAFTMNDWQRISEAYELKGKASKIKHRTKGYDEQDQKRQE